MNVLKTVSFPKHSVFHDTTSILPLFCLLFALLVSGTGCTTATSQLNSLWPGQQNVLEQRLASLRLLEQSGQLLEARTEYEKLLKRYPKEPKIYQRLGILSQLQGRNQEAVNFLESAHQLAPTSGSIINDLGFALHLQGDNRRAISVLRKAQEINPLDQRVQSNLAVALAATGDVRSSYSLLRQSADESNAASGVGFALAQSGRIPEAIDYFSRALDADPDNTAAAEALLQLTRSISPQPDKLTPANSPQHVGYMPQESRLPQAASYSVSPSFPSSGNLKEFIDDTSSDVIGVSGLQLHQRAGRAVMRKNVMVSSDQEHSNSSSSAPVSDATDVLKFQVVTAAERGIQNMDSLPEERSALVKRTIPLNPIDDSTTCPQQNSGRDQLRVREVAPELSPPSEGTSNAALVKESPWPRHVTKWMSATQPDREFLELSESNNDSQQFTHVDSHRRRINQISNQMLQSQTDQTEEKSPHRPDKLEVTPQPKWGVQNDLPALTHIQDVSRRNFSVQSPEAAVQEEIAKEFDLQSCQLVDASQPPSHPVEFASQDSVKRAEGDHSSITQVSSLEMKSSRLTSVINDPWRAVDPTHPGSRPFDWSRSIADPQSESRTTDRETIATGRVGDNQHLEQVATNQIPSRVVDSSTADPIERYSSKAETRRAPNKLTPPGTLKLPTEATIVRALQSPRTNVESQQLRESLNRPPSIASNTQDRLKAGHHRRDSATSRKPYADDRSLANRRLVFSEQTLEELAAEYFQMSPTERQTLWQSGRLNRATALKMFPLADGIERVDAVIAVGHSMQWDEFLQLGLNQLAHSEVPEVRNYAQLKIKELTQP